MNPWIPDNNPHQARRIGKTLEEVGELAAVLARISIQGLDAIDPSSGKTNRQRFIDETADVIAQINCNFRAFDMPADEIDERVQMKEASMDAWEKHFRTDGAEGRVAAGGHSQAVIDVTTERRRQIDVEGWTPRHDDEHDDRSLAAAAACYANPGALRVPPQWPWDHRWWKPSDPRRMLVKAGALILAEIERLDRAAAAEGAR